MRDVSGHTVAGAARSRAPRAAAQPGFGHGRSPRLLPSAAHGLAGHPTCPVLSRLIPANPALSRLIPPYPGESHLIPDDPGLSQSIRDSHYECWAEIAPPGVSHQPHVDPVPRAGLTLSLRRRVLVKPVPSTAGARFLIPRASRATLAWLRAFGARRGRAGRACGPVPIRAGYRRYGPQRVAAGPSLTQCPEGSARRAVMTCSYSLPDKVSNQSPSARPFGWRAPCKPRPWHEARAALRAKGKYRISCRCRS